MDLPLTRYLDREGGALAYQVVGSGPVDVLWFFEINMHLDLCWTDPHIHRLADRATSYSRTVILQRRGFGLSDPVDFVPTVEQQADDVVAVMDAVGVDRAVIAGGWGACAALSLVAAREPSRVTALVLMNPMVQGPALDSERLVGWTAEQASDALAVYRKAFGEWGSGATIEAWDSTLRSAFNRRLAAMLERCSATPAAASAYLEWLMRLDFTEVLASVRVPTLILRVQNNPIPDAAVRHAAALVPGARFEVLPVPAPGSSIGEAWLPLLEHVEEMATGAHDPADTRHGLASLLFTDIVGSTDLVALIGDVAYGEIRAGYERQVRAAVEAAGGTLVSVTGDGTLSTFDGPAKAVRCAASIGEAAKILGIEVRAGVHTGHVNRTVSDLTGLTVHVGARIGAAAVGGEVLVSRTVRDLVRGSGLQFERRGTRQLKGVPGDWELFALAQDAGRVAVQAEVRDPTVADRVALTTARRSPGLARAAVRMCNSIQKRSARTFRS